METQPELIDEKEKGRGVSPEQVTLLLRLLRGRDWQKAAQITALVYLDTIASLGTANAQRWTDRFVRMVASASEGQVISYPGSPGYKLTAEATIAEIQAAAKVLRHQAEQMQERALQIDRVYHGKIRP